MRIGIVGAGMAGLACAEKLEKCGHMVFVLDKGRGPGGRMSTDRLYHTWENGYIESFNARMRDEFLKPRDLLHAAESQDSDRSLAQEI